MNGVVAKGKSFFVASKGKIVEFREEFEGGPLEHKYCGPDFSQSGGDEKDEKESAVTAFGVSPCGRYLYIAYANKTVVCWDMVMKKEKTRTELKKRATGLVSSVYEEKQILFVLDKSGDVLVSNGLKLDSWADAGGGHTASIITDMMVTESKELFISCDRDEKIRVCNCPDIYRVISYCLGHQDVISSICEVSLKGRSLLVSAGWDHKLCLWDAVEGKLLSMLSTKIEKVVDAKVEEDVGAEDLRDDKKNAAEVGDEGDEGDGDGGGEERTYYASDAGAFPSKVRAIKWSDEMYVGVTFNDSSKFAVYSATTAAGGFEFTEVASMQLKGTPVDFAFNGRQIMFLLPAPVHQQIFEVGAGLQFKEKQSEEFVRECTRSGENFQTQLQSLGADPESGKRALGKHTIKRKFTDMLRGAKDAPDSSSSSNDGRDSGRKGSKAS